MDDRQKQAATAIAAGKTIEEVSNEVGRSPRAIRKWMEDPEVQAAVIRGIRALALLTLAQYLKHGEAPKAGQAALATLRWLGAGKPKRADVVDHRGAHEDDETDLDEFSEEQLRRLKGDA